MSDGLRVALPGHLRAARLTLREVLLGGADGIDSAVRRQLLPQAEAADTGTRVIYGKAPYDGRVRDALPEAAAARLGPGVTVHDCGSYVMWALSASARTFPPNVTGLDGERLTVARQPGHGAIARYEPEMRDYGFAAVLASQQANARYHR